MTSQTPPTSLHPPIGAPVCLEGRGHHTYPPFPLMHLLLHPPPQLKTLIHRLCPLLLMAHPIIYQWCPALQCITRPSVSTPMRMPVRLPWARGGACWKARVKALSWMGKNLIDTSVLHPPHRAQSNLPTLRWGKDGSNIPEFSFIHWRHWQHVSVSLFTQWCMQDFVRVSGALMFACIFSSV